MSTSNNQAGPGSGSNWLRQAVAGARASQQPKNAPPGTPDWQQGFHKGEQSPTEVPDMLAAAETPVTAPQAPAQRLSAPATPQAPTPQPASGMIMGAFGEDVPTVPVSGTGTMSTGKKVLVVVAILILILAAASAGYSLFAPNR